MKFGPNGLETWPCEHFFSNGILTGNKLLRQFKQVVHNCEYIESQVYGCVLDAGGNNARFVSMLHDLKRLTSSVWLDDESCYIDNWKDKSRWIYF